MKQTSIKKQVAAIERATADAEKSPEKARAFLIEAGIINAENTRSTTRKTNRKPAR